MIDKEIELGPAYLVIDCYSGGTGSGDRLFIKAFAFLSFALFYSGYRQFRLLSLRLALTISGAGYISAFLHGIGNPAFQSVAVWQFSEGLFLSVQGRDAAWIAQSRAIAGGTIENGIRYNQAMILFECAGFYW